ncbi:Hypothetical predicted protein [Prunus dulcis]|uniref:Uncharacterized protein n=1 Tax=Prunus dulcis TaxID=3755 RepID=A0A5E4G1H3_PRUDU|nr:Hypothetical predicted protein [Prunus dulcis]
MVVAEKKEEEPEPCGLSGSSVVPTLLDHHVVEVLVVGDGDEGIEIFVGELREASLEAKAESLDVAIYGEDFGVIAERMRAGGRAGRAVWGGPRREEGERKKKSF